MKFGVLWNSVGTEFGFYRWGISFMWFYRLEMELEFKK